MIAARDGKCGEVQVFEILTDLGADQTWYLTKKTLSHVQSSLLSQEYT